MAKDDDKAKAADKATVEIIYMPEEGDPLRVKWGGLEFVAHKATVVSTAHAIPQLLRKDILMPDGSVQSRSFESRMTLVELARKNPSFAVDGERATRKLGTAKAPSDPDGYRGYAIYWIAASTDGKAMDARWAAEEPLREKCGCADKDIAYLRPFFEARHDMVKGDAA